MSAEARPTSRTTTHHEEIRSWAKQRDGRPVAKRSTDNAGDAAALSVQFGPTRSEDSLEEIPWEEWFESFEVHRLAFVYEDEDESGEPSMFFRLVRRATR